MGRSKICKPWHLQIKAQPGREEKAKISHKWVILTVSNVQLMFRALYNVASLVQRHATMKGQCIRPVHELLRLRVPGRETKGKNSHKRAILIVPKAWLIFRASYDAATLVQRHEQMRGQCITPAYEFPWHVQIKAQPGRYKHC